MSARLGVVGMAALFLLTACGDGGGKDEGSGGIKGADKGDSSTPSASSASGVKRPKIKFPGTAKNVFEEQRTGDEKKDAVLADHAAWVNAVDDAIFRGKLTSPAVTFYSVGAALSNAEAYIKRYVGDGESWEGTTRFFNRKVTFLKDGSAAVVYCSDESKSFITDAKTGKKQKSSGSSKDAYVLYNMHLVKSDDGVWQTTNGDSERGATQCQP